MTRTFPVYDIHAIDNEGARRGLLIERFHAYLEKHYQQLHHAHRHSFYHLVLFTRGAGTHTIDFVTYPVRAGQVYFMIPGQVHSWHFEGEVDGYIVHFNESLFTSFLQDGQYLERFHFFTGNSEDGVCELPSLVLDQAAAVFEAMLREVVAAEVYQLDMIRVKLLEFFIMAERFDTGRKGQSFPPQKMALLRNFKQLIDKQFRKLKLPKEYAEPLHVTTNHLNAVCQELVGKTAGDLIRDRVVLEAKRLLVNADLSITEIAYELNFSDGSYFTKFFRKYAGMTPEEFRRGAG